VGGAEGAARVGAMRHDQDGMLITGALDPPRYPPGNPAGGHAATRKRIATLAAAPYAGTARIAATMSALFAKLRLSAGRRLRSVPLRAAVVGATACAAAFGFLAAMTGARARARPSARALPAAALFVPR